jgi:hypothetical protein
MMTYRKRKQRPPTQTRPRESVLAKLEEFIVFLILLVVISVFIAWASRQGP